MSEQEQQKTEEQENLFAKILYYTGEKARGYEYIVVQDETEKKHIVYIDEKLPDNYIDNHVLFYGNIIKNTEKYALFMSTASPDLVEEIDEIEEAPAIKQQDFDLEISKADEQLINSIVTHDEMEQTLSKKAGKYLEFERRDEDQILAEIRGNVIDDYAYRFRSGGKIVTGISYAGIKSIIEKRGGYEIVTPISDIMTEYDDKYVAIVKVRDKINDTEGVGYIEEKKMKTGKNGMWKDDFAAQKALSKAIRNAYRSIIDEAFIKQVVEQWFKMKGGQ